MARPNPIPTPAPRPPAPPAIRYVLGELAVRRLRQAEEQMAELHRQAFTQWPAAITAEIAGAYLALAEAVLEIGRCNVENAPAATTTEGVES